MNDLRLIATDLDGTLIGRGDEFAGYPRFRDRIDDVRRDLGCKWVVCTGRSLRGFRAVFMPLRHAGIVPDYLITRHAYIFSRTRWGFIPHIIWNVTVKNLEWRSRLTIRRTLARCREAARERFHRARVLRATSGRLCLRLPDADTTQAAAHLMQAVCDRCRNLNVFQYMLEVDVRAVPFTKGLALGALADHLDLAPQQILAVGDGHNDISMMDGHVAALTGCPANAEPEVMQAVHDAGGHIATAPVLAGTAEVIEAHMTEQIRSALPPHWKHPSLTENPMPAKASRSQRPHGSPRGRLILFGVCCCVVLLVFASLGVPPFLRPLAKPFHMLVAFLARLLG